MSDLATDTLNDQVDLIEKLLNDLGDDPAAVLRAEGIKGRRKCADACPIYEYLRAHGVKLDIAVNSLEVSVILLDAEWTYVECPAPVGKFIRDFDNGLKYQEFVSAECRD